MKSTGPLHLAALRFIGLANSILCGQQFIEWRRILLLCSKCRRLFRSRNIAPLLNRSQRKYETPIDVTPPCPPTLDIEPDCRSTSTNLEQP